MKTSKGIILAGGSGSRLYPSTIAVNKQLLNLYDKPIIYYSISVLMLAKIRDILIISSSENLYLYKKLFGSGKNFGIKISYEIQEKPNGIAESFLIGEKFIDRKKVALILGDNFFYGNNFSKNLIKASSNKNSTIFLFPSNFPENYGVATVKKNQILNIIEKPKKPKSNLAVTGLYFYDNKVVDYCKLLKPSKRGELEITDLNKIYIGKKKLNYINLGRGFNWFDTGTPETLLEASNFVHAIEKRQRFKISCLEEISLNNNWLNKQKLKKNINKIKNCDYKNYIKKILIQK